jgi:hypothetical protein
MDFTLHQINIQQGDQKTPEYGKINPFRKIPALVDSDGPGGKPATVAVDPTTGRVMWSLPEAPSAAGAGRPPTESEAKDYLYASMMENAMPDIRSTVDSVRPEVITALRVDPSGMSKMTLTDNEKVFWRGVLEFTAAVNRKESGAAITPFEVSNTLDRYVDTGFDGAPDTPVRRAKAKARENIYNTMRRASGRARAYYDGGAPMPGTDESQPSYEEWLAMTPAQRDALKSRRP